MFVVWPWESVRNKIRTALTELCVVSDVLTIATKVSFKKYFFLRLYLPKPEEWGGGHFRV